MSLPQLIIIFEVTERCLPSARTQIFHVKCWKENSLFHNLRHSMRPAAGWCSVRFKVQCHPYNYAKGSWNSTYFDLRPVSFGMTLPSCLRQFQVVILGSRAQ